MKQLFAIMHIILGLGLGYSQSLSAQTIVSFDVHENSFLEINGSSNLSSFRIGVAGKNLSGYSHTISVKEVGNIFILGENCLSVAIKEFSSKNRMALNDFRKLIKIDSYPNLFIRLNSFELERESNGASNDGGMASISLNITGKTKQYTIPISIEREGDLFVIQGHKKISIRDFGLAPPVEMMGLIKVSEWIDISFNLRGTITVVRQCF